MLSEERIFENVKDNVGATDDDEGRTPEHGYTISSPGKKKQKRKHDIREIKQYSSSVMSHIMKTEPSLAARNCLQ